MRAKRALAPWNALVKVVEHLPALAGDSGRWL